MTIFGVAADDYIKSENVHGNVYIYIKSENVHGNVYIIPIGKIIIFSSHQMFLSE